MISKSAKHKYQPKEDTRLKKWLLFRRKKEFCYENVFCVCNVPLLACKQTVSVFMCVVYFNFFFFFLLSFLESHSTSWPPRTKVYWNLWLFAHICSPFRRYFPTLQKQPCIRFVHRRRLKHSLYRCSLFLLLSYFVKQFLCCRRCNRSTQRVS